MVDRNSVNLCFLMLTSLQLTSGGASTADGGFRKSYKRHFADVKHIVGNNQAIKWSIEILQFTFVYVNKIATNARRRLPAASGDRSNGTLTTSNKHIVGDDQDRSKFCNYEDLCLRDQAKPFEKHFFAVITSPL